MEISKDTAEFAVNSIRTWWQQMGKDEYEGAKELMITADSGASNSSRSRLWKKELQILASETGMEISVCHFHPAQASGIKSNIGYFHLLRKTGPENLWKA